MRAENVFSRREHFATFCSTPSAQGFVLEGFLPMAELVLCSCLTHVSSSQGRDNADRELCALMEVMRHFYLSFMNDRIVVTPLRVYVRAN